MRAAGAVLSIAEHIEFFFWTEAAEEEQEFRSFFRVFMCQAILLADATLFELFLSTVQWHHSTYLVLSMNIVNFLLLL